MNGSSRETCLGYYVPCKQFLVQSLYGLNMVTMMCSYFAFSLTNEDIKRDPLCKMDGN